MDHTNEKKAKLQITMSAMTLTGILIAELFVLNQGYGVEIFSVGFGIVALIAVSRFLASFKASNILIISIPLAIDF